MVPEVDELVLKAIFIAEKGAERCYGLFCQVVIVKRLLLLAFGLERITILIFGQSKGFKICAQVELLHDGSEHFIRQRADTVRSIYLLGVEIGDALAAHRAGEHILVSIDESVDSSIS